jgi:hypothetical protein
MPGGEVPVSLLFTLRFADAEFLHVPNKSFALAHLTLVYRGHPGCNITEEKRKVHNTHRGRKKPIHSSSTSEHVLKNVQWHVFR